MATLANSVHADFKWQHFGADPYASSRDEAMRTRESAFSKLDLPKPVVKLLVGSDTEAGRKGQTRERRQAIDDDVERRHRPSRVTAEFVKPPVSGKMEYAAPAEKRQVTWEGKSMSLSSRNLLQLELDCRPAYQEVELPSTHRSADMFVGNQI